MYNPTACVAYCALLCAHAAAQTANTDAFGWLDFDMDLNTKKQLFREGAIAGLELLSKWVWQIREHSTAVHTPAALTVVHTPVALT
jgi:hypothetical protein